MVRTAPLAFAVIVLCGAALAKSPPAVARYPLRVTTLSNPLLARLKATPEQKQKLAALRRRAADEKNAILKKSGGSPDPKSLRTVAEIEESQALAVLKPEQRKELERMETEAAQFPWLGPAVPALLAVTNLTPAQRAKLGRLSDAASAGGETGKANDAFVKAVADVRAVLTPAQRKQFDAALDPRWSKKK